MSSLTDNESSELFDELLKGAPQHDDRGDDDEEEAEPWDQWQPDPVDANPGKYGCVLIGSLCVNSCLGGF